MIILIIIIGISALLIGIGIGYWFACYTEIIDLKNQRAQLKGRCDMLEDLVTYYESKDKEKEGLL